jgi:hypothetical protein
MLTSGSDLLCREFEKEVAVDDGNDQRLVVAPVSVGLAVHRVQQIARRSQCSGAVRFFRHLSEYLISDSVSYLIRKLFTHLWEVRK